MSDARQSGSMNEDRQAQPVTIDLTRIDIRRGTIHLPRRFLGILTGGDLAAEDTVSGESFTIAFTPPRELSGLVEFFESHELRPNDALTLRLTTDGLALTPLKRERRKVTEQERPRFADAPEEYSRGDVPVARREEAEIEPAVFEGIVRERRIESRHDEDEKGWQSVLHSPRQQSREIGSGTPPERAEAERQRAETAPESGRKDTPERPQALDTGSGEPWHLTPRDLSNAPAATPDHTPRQLETERQEGLVRERKRVDPGRGIPLAREQEAQQGLFEAHEAPEAARPAGEERELARSAPEAQTHGRPAWSAQETEAAEEERMPVAAGGDVAAKDAASEVAGYLYSPAAPAIVRAAEVAEKLGLPVDEAKQALHQVSRNSDGAVTPIRQDVYLIKRGG